MTILTYPGRPINEGPSCLPAIPSLTPCGYDDINLHMFNSISENMHLCMTNMSCLLGVF